MTLLVLTLILILFLLILSLKKSSLTVKVSTKDFTQEIESTDYESINGKDIYIHYSKDKLLIWSPIADEILYAYNDKYYLVPLTISNIAHYILTNQPKEVFNFRNLTGVRREVDHKNPLDILLFSYIATSIQLNKS